MEQKHIALLVDEVKLTIDEMTASCIVSREWLIEHVQAGVLQADPTPNAVDWKFSGRDLKRARRLRELERDFDANPELAGLAADLFDEVERLRRRLRRAGLPVD